MRYLVLGSTSFAGSSFIEYLLSHDEEVIGISRSLEPHAVMQPYFNHPRKSAFSYYQFDINMQLDSIIQIINQKKPRYIVDFAGQGMVAESWNDPAQWYQTNIISKIKLYECLKQSDFLDCYVRASTPEVYGNTLMKVKEDYSYYPSTPYAVSHAAIDMSLLAFHKNYQFPVILTRFANFYGPHQQLFRIIPRSMIYALLGKKLPLHGGGTSERMFIYADDVSNGIDKAIQHGKKGEIYHFSSEPLLSIKNLVEKISELMKIDPYSLIEITSDRAGKDNKYIMDTTKSEIELGWKPQVTLEEGLEKTLSWVRKNIHILKSLPLDYIHKT